MFIQRAIESYLFDERHAGYGKPEYLSWAMEMAKVLASSSGGYANQNPRWDPVVAGQHPIPDKDGKVYDWGVRYHPASFDRPDHNTSPNRPGVREDFDPAIHDPAAERGEV